MRVLVACEEFGRVREAFRKKGHDAWSCDLYPAFDGSPYHIQDNVLTVLGNGWDMVIAFPPCTFLSSVRNCAYYDDKAREQDLKQRHKAIQFVDTIWASNDRVCIENPVGALSTQWRKPSQIIQPYWFGEPWHKKTCLWLKGLPELQMTNWVGSNGSWHFQGSKNARRRARTFQGIADAMADQWG